MAAATKEPKKVKKGFKMPHLFWIMICLLFVSSLLTYVIPAGQFMTDPETGKILGDQFQYLGEAFLCQHAHHIPFFSVTSEYTQNQSKSITFNQSCAKFFR